MSSRHAGVVSVGVFVPEFYARRFITDFARENPEVTFEINGRDDGRGALCNDPYDVVFLSRTEGYSGFTCVDFALDGLGVVVPPDTVLPVGSRSLCPSWRASGLAC